MEKFHYLPLSWQQKSLFFNDNEANLSDELLSEGVESQIPLCIVSISKNMVRSPLKKPKRNQLSTIKKLQTDLEELTPTKSIKEIKSKSFISEEFKLHINSVDREKSSRVSRKEDISMLLKQAVYQRKKSSLVEEKHKSVSMRIENNIPYEVLENKEEANYCFITFGEI